MTLFRFLSIVFVLTLCLPIANAQNSKDKKEPNQDKKKETSHELDRSLDYKKEAISEHIATVAGQKVPYRTTSGVLPVWDEDGKVIAGVFYNYFERTDVSDKSSRPLVFSFNGGPGTASVWMMIGYTGPRLLNIDDEGYPIQPYGMRDNPNSIIDVADIVYVDPVNTGFSRPVNNDVPKDKFFGVNADINYLAGWINTFVNKYNRWASPKYLIGESYGTTRVSGLALKLQSSYWMYLNGVILVSPTTLGIERDGPVNEALIVPYYAATAWYHKTLNSSLQSKDLESLLQEVEHFTVNELLPGLSLGSSIASEAKQKLVKKYSQYTSLSEQFILDNNLRVGPSAFWKELLRHKGYTIGRLDSRYLGLDSKDAGTNPESNAELNAWLHAFTPAINIYLRQELKYQTELDYNMFGPVYPWNNENNQTGKNLQQAMNQNPYLHIMVQSGYFDGATDYYNSKYNLWQIDSKGVFKDRMKWHGYQSGHMMYLRKEDLKQANEDLRRFIINAIPAKGVPAKFQIK